MRQLGTQQSRAAYQSQKTLVKMRVRQARQRQQIDRADTINAKYDAKVSDKSK